MPNFNQIQLLPTFFSMIIGIWVLYWKGIALWKSAEHKQQYWFIIILVLNGLTLGILEIIYLFKFAKKKMELKELKFWQPKP